jgi:hypothetical protein
MDPVYEDVPALEIKGQWALTAAEPPPDDGSPRRRGQGCAYPGFNVTHTKTGMALAGYLTEAVARDLLDKAFVVKPRGAITAGEAMMSGQRPLIRALRTFVTEAVDASTREVRASGVAWMRYPADVLP